MKAIENQKPVKFIYALLPVLFLLLMVIYGLILRTRVLGQPAFPLEIIFLLCAAFAIGELMLLGFGWPAIQQAIIKKLARALPAFFILFSIGMIISSWIISGTVPMLVYYGIKLISARFIYLFAFLIPVVFSTLTGTSWGSAGTIGVVIIGIGTAMNAHPGIIAGAIIGGAYFGDKMSPLSDTTNLAAIATDVPLFDHIRSMVNTTVPAAILAAISFFILGFIHPPAVDPKTITTASPFLSSLKEMFHFNLLLILPPVIVLYGSLARKPIIPTLFISITVACILAAVFQRFGFTNTIQALYKGFNTKMAGWMNSIPQQVSKLLNRGGLYALNEPIIISFMVFIYIGAIDCINAMPRVINKILGFARRRSSTILATLFASAVTNSLTSNQFATSFIVGDAFKKKYDDLKIPRKVLSRSLEDTGTMMESMVPWTTTAVFMVATLGVPFQDYWHWQLMSLFNFIIAPLLAILGIGCFYNKEKSI